MPLDYLLATCVSGLTMAGIAYPGYAVNRGWPVGAWVRGENWSIWYFGAAIGSLFCWWKVAGLVGLAIAVPASMIAGLFLTVLAGKSIQLISLFATPAAWAMYLWLTFRHLL